MFLFHCPDVEMAMTKSLARSGEMKEPADFTKANARSKSWNQPLKLVAKVFLLKKIGVRKSKYILYFFLLIRFMRI